MNDKSTLLLHCNLKIRMNFISTHRYMIRITVNTFTITCTLTNSHLVYLPHELRVQDGTAKTLLRSTQI